MSSKITHTKHQLTFNCVTYQIELSTADLSHVHLYNPSGEPRALSVAQIHVGRDRGFYLEHHPTYNPTDDCLAGCRDIIVAYYLLNKNKHRNKPNKRKGKL